MRHWKPCTSKTNPRLRHHRLLTGERWRGHTRHGAGDHARRDRPPEHFHFKACEAGLSRRVKSSSARRLLNGAALSLIQAVARPWRRGDAIYSDEASSPAKIISTRLCRRRHAARDANIGIATCAHGRLRLGVASAAAIIDRCLRHGRFDIVLRRHHI